MQHVRSSHGPFFLCGAQRDARYSRRLTSRTELTVGCLSRSKTSLNLFVYVSFFFSPTKKVGFLWCVSKWGPFISVGPMKTLTVQQVFLCRRQHTCVFFLFFWRKIQTGRPFSMEIVSDAGEHVDGFLFVWKRSGSNFLCQLEHFNQRTQRT